LNGKETPCIHFALPPVSVWVGLVASILTQKDQLEQHLFNNILAPSSNITLQNQDYQNSPLFVIVSLDFRVGVDDALRSHIPSQKWRS